MLRETKPAPLRSNVRGAAWVDMTPCGECRSFDWYEPGEFADWEDVKGMLRKSYI